MNYTEPPHYYSSCDFEMLGSCHDCLIDHPGNWFVLLEDGISSCCVSSLSDVKFPRKMETNSTTNCPTNMLLASAPYLLGGHLLTVGLVALGMFGKWIYNKCVKKNRVQPEAEMGIEMSDLAATNGHAQFEANDGEMVEVPAEGEGGNDEWESIDLGYLGDGERTSPPLSEDERLNVLCMNLDENEESDGEEGMFTMDM